MRRCLGSLTGMAQMVSQLFLLLPCPFDCPWPPWRMSLGPCALCNRFRTRCLKLIRLLEGQRSKTLSQCHGYTAVVVGSHCRAPSVAVPEPSLLLWLMAHFGAGHHVSQYLRLRLPGILGRRLAELGDAREAMSQGRHTS